MSMSRNTGDLFGSIFDIDGDGVTSPEEEVLGFLTFEESFDDPKPRLGKHTSAFGSFEDEDEDEDDIDEDDDFDDEDEF